MKPVNTPKDIAKEDFVTGGTGTCAGCGAMLGIKLVLKALGRRTIIVNTSGCITLTPTYPYTPYKVPWVHLAIENAGSAATGISMGMRALKKGKDVNVVCYSGDGATYDIGLESLSAMAERFENVLWVCYNNSSFANTGYQWSSATPPGSRTLTTPPGRKNIFGSTLRRKPLAKIMAAHDIPYVATACVSHAIDFIQKLQKASKIIGPKFIDLLTPCQPGWGYEPYETIEIGRLMVESGLWPLYEVENKKLKISMVPKFIPVEQALLKQERFSHLKKDHIEIIQKMVNKEWALLKKGKLFEAEEW